MLALKSWIRRPLRELQRQPWPLSTAVAPRLNLSHLIEEEKTPYYDPKRFYPAHLGEVFNSRYQISTKLGYGTSSTVWLARDLHQWSWAEERYVTIKLNANDHHTRQKVAQAELSILKCISKTNSQHKGWHFVRKLLDSFTVEGESGRHVCLVFEPLREPLWLYSEICGERYTLRNPQNHASNDSPGTRLSPYRVSGYLYWYDYRQAHNLKPDNIMVKIEDISILDRDARNEFEHPLPRKQCEDGRTIYLSRNNYGQPSATTGIVRITDFGLSVRGHLPHRGCIQAEVYRAPEVIIDAGYTYSADIWSLGVMLWDLLEGRRLFKAVDPHNVDEYDDEKHLAYITALLGPPPRDLLDEGQRTSMFYGPDGRLKDPALIPQDFSFENTLGSIKGEEKKMFIEFVKRMIKWRPEERSTANQLFSDPWLYTDFPES